MASWNAYATARYGKYRDEAQTLRATARTKAQLAGLDGADLALERVEALLRRRFRFWPWWRAGRRLDVWDAVHDAEMGLLAARDLRSRVSAAVEHAHRELPTTTAELRAAELRAEGDPAERAALALELIEECHDTARDSLRTMYRRTRLLWALAAAAGAAAVGAMVAQVTIETPFLAAPTLAGGRSVQMSPAELLALVGGCGAVGGLLRAAADLTRPNTVVDTRWIDPRLARAATKMVAGAWFGVIGVLAVASGFIVAEYSSIGAVLLLGILFGYGQRLLTAPLAKRLGDALGTKPGAATTTTRAPQNRRTGS